MSGQIPPSNGREPHVERYKSSKPTGRLRSACDSCHQAKIKCSGESPCSTCHVSQLRCIYSPGSRQGRPKGSKNKRTLMQENKNKGTEIQKHKNSGNALQIKEPRQLQQQQPDTMPAEYDLDLEHELDTAFSGDQRLSGNPNILLSPNMASFLDSMHVDYDLEHGFDTNFSVHTSSKDDSNSSFAQVSAELVQPAYNASPNETPDSCKCDSGYATGTVDSSPNDSTLSSPHSCILPGDNSRPSGSTSLTGSHHCSCLQQQAQLVYELEELRHTYAEGPTVDSVLQGVQLAQGPWEILRQCSQCQGQNNQKEVFLLFAMSIRTLLSSIQKPNTSDIGVSVGNYKLIGETKTEVINILIRGALQSITSALLHLQERTGRPKPLPVADLGNSNSAPESPSSILTSISTESQMLPNHTFLPPANLGAENLGSLLSTLQSTMQAMNQDLRGSV